MNPAARHHPSLLIIPFTAIVFGFAAHAARGDDNSDPFTASEFDETAAVSGVLRRYCFECHGAEVQEAGLRLDVVDLQHIQLTSARTLENILTAVGSQRMPPDGVTAPADSERTLLVSWLDEQLTNMAAEARRNRTRNRPLNTEEYDFTLQALFQVDAEFADLLPPDPRSSAGYRNDSDRLNLSSLQMETYLDSARRAVDRYVQFGDIQEQPLRYHIELEDLFYSTADRYGSRKRAPSPIDADFFAACRDANRSAPSVFVDPLGPKLAGAFSDDEMLRAAIPKLNQQYVALPKRHPTGELIVRVRAAGTADRDGRFPRMRVEAGVTLGDGCSINKRSLGEVDVTAPTDAPQIYEFRIRLEDVPTKGPLNEETSFDRLSLFDMDQLFISNVSCDECAIFDLGRGGYSDPKTGSREIADALARMAADGVSFLHLDCLEIKMLPGVSESNRNYQWQVDLVDGQDESRLARGLLNRFMERAYRRPVLDSEIDAKLQLFTELRRSHSFEVSLRETLAAVLISPSFLLLESTPPNVASDSVLTPYQLAARLSYFLSLSSPDDELMESARNGSLMDPATLREQTTRLLADPRSQRMQESFCRQWLRLDKHANVAVHRATNPDWDDDLSDLSIQETLATFVEIFRSNTSALDLIDSDYALLNDRLARHYGMSNVTSGRLQKVQLAGTSPRGGLLTQASLLTMNSTGIDSHPVRRGAWLLDRLLNQPPPPPPPDVPVIDDDDPDFRGLSLKQQIERHRQPGSCLSCHEQIDPWGMPFENFDATGRWRDTVTVREDGELHSQSVDSVAVLPDGHRVSGVRELKAYLRRQRRDEFANALVHHMLTYALGRTPDYADRGHVAEIRQRFTDSDYRLKELVLAIIDSELFRED